MVNVTELKYRGGQVLRLHFSDGRVGDDEMGTVAWPNGADVAPEFLYDASLPINGVDEPG